MNKHTRSSHISCFSCKKLGFDLKKLVFDRYICENCIDCQCESELNEIEAFESKNESKQILTLTDVISKSTENQRNKTNSISKNNLGAKLYEIKNEMSEFSANLSFYDKFIKNKLDIIKFEINQVYEFNLKKLNLTKAYYTNLINNYELDLFAKLKRLPTTAPVERHDVQMASFNLHLTSRVNEKNFKLFEKSYLLNELISELELIRLGSFQNRDESNANDFKNLKNIEVKISDYEQVIKSNVEQFYASIYANKFMVLNEAFVKSSANTLIKKHLSVGFLKSKSSSSDNYNNEAVNDVQEGNLALMSNKLEVGTIGQKMSLEVHSLHVIYDPAKKTEKFILFYKSENNACKLELYDHGGDLIKKVSIKEKRVFALNSNEARLVLCYSDVDKDNQNKEIKLATFDHELQLVACKTIQKFVDPSNNQLPVDLYVDAKRVFLLMVNFELKHTLVFAFNFSLDLLNSFYLDKNAFLRRNNTNLAYLRVSHVENKLFIKQKSLYGTRLDIIDAISGIYLDKVVIDLQFDCFFVDPTAKYLNFMCEGKMYSYDLIGKKVLNISYLNNSDKMLDAFCVSKEFMFNTLFTN